MKTHSSIAHVRWMIKKDFHRVMEIESLCFIDPMSEKQFKDLLRDRNTIAYVAQMNPHSVLEEPYIVGYLIYRLHPVSVEIFSIAVDPAFQKQGFGAAMLEKVIRSRVGSRRPALSIYVYENDPHVLCWLRDRKFRSTQVIQDPRLDHYDLIRMEYFWEQ